MMGKYSSSRYIANPLARVIIDCPEKLNSLLELVELDGKRSLSNITVVK